MGKCNIFTPIARVKCFDGFSKVFFNNCFKSDKNIFDFRLLFERIEPNISGEMIHKNDIIFESII